MTPVFSTSPGVRQVADAHMAKVVDNALPGKNSVRENEVSDRMANRG
jgi:hypothetical protein